MVHLERHAVRHHNAVAADIDHAQLTALQKIVHAKIFHRVDVLVQPDFLVNRHRAQRHDAVDMAVHRAHVILDKNILHQKFLADFLSRHRAERNFPRRIPDVHTNTSKCAQPRACQCLCRFPATDCAPDYSTTFRKICKRWAKTLITTPYYHSHNKSYKSTRSAKNKTLQLTDELKSQSAAQRTIYENCIDLKN